MAFEYRVSLQIRHPSADPNEIVRRMGQAPVRVWRVGEPRVTPKGTALGGTYRETYCVFHVGSGDDGELASCLRRAVADLEGAKHLFEDLRSEGGSIKFHVTWSTGERGDVFDTSLLSGMVELGIDLGIEPLSSA